MASYPDAGAAWDEISPPRPSNVAMRCTIGEHRLCRFEGTCECSCHATDPSTLTTRPALTAQSIPPDMAGVSTPPGQTP